MARENESNPPQKETEQDQDPLLTNKYIPGTKNESQASLHNSTSENKTTHHSLPEKFGRYRIKKLLGKGAMGAVYLAEDTQLQREVALKTPTFSGENPKLLERFYREARSAATLHNKNICTIFDVGEIDGTHYISMAYIQGSPLSEYINPAQLQPQQQVVNVMIKLTRALQEAHDAGIVHRDLKPDNIMIDTKGEPVIMDFGLARQSHMHDVSMTASGAIMGTPAYMAPEQVRGQQDVIGPASDQYSLGVVLYEMLVGKRPFAGALGVVMSQILNDTPAQPSTIQKNINSQLESICLKMMSKAKNDRYASLSDVATELERCFQQKPGSTQNVSLQKVATLSVITNTKDGIEIPLPQTVIGPSTSETATTIISENKRGFAKKLIFTAGALVLGLSSWAGFMLIKSSSEGTVVIQLNANIPEETKINLSNNDQSYLVNKSKNWSINLPEGRYQIDIAGNNDRLKLSSSEVNVVENKINIISVSLKSAEINISHQNRYSKQNPASQLPIPPKNRIAKTTPVSLVGLPGEAAIYQYHQQTIYDVAFSQQKDFVAVASQDGFVSLWHYRSGKHIRDIQVENLIPSAVSFSPTNNSVLIGYTTGEVRLCVISTGAIFQAYNGHKDWITKVTFSPRMRYIATASSSGSFRLWSVAGGKELVQYPRKAGMTWGGDVTFLSQAQLLISTKEEGTRIFDLESGRERRRFEARAGNRCLTVSKDKKFLVVHSGPLLQMWNIETGKKIRDFRQHHNETNSPITEFHFLPDGRHLAGITNRMVYVWDVETGQEVYRKAFSLTAFSTMAVSPYGRLLVIGSQREQKQINDQKNEELRRCDLRFLRLPKVVWTPDQDDIIFKSVLPQALSTPVSPDGNPGLIATYSYHKKQIDVVKFSPDGKRLASGTHRPVTLWEFPSGKRLRDYPAEHDILFLLESNFSQPSGTNAITFSKDSKTMITGSGEGYGTICICDVATGTIEKTFQIPKLQPKISASSTIYDVAYSPDENILAISQKNCPCLLYALNKKGLNGKQIIRLQAAKAKISNSRGTKKSLWSHFGKVAFLTNNKVLFTTSYHGCFVQDIHATQPLRHIPTMSISDAAISPDKKILAVCDQNEKRTILLWDIETGQEIRSIGEKEIKSQQTSYGASFHHLHFLPNGRHLVAIERMTRTCFVWNVELGKVVYRLELKSPIFSVTSFDLHPDGNYIVMGVNNRVKNETDDIHRQYSNTEQLQIIRLPKEVWTIK